MSIQRIAAISMLSVVLVAGRAHAQAAGRAVMVPGLWEITVQTRFPVVASPLSHTVCIDDAHVTRPEPPKAKPTDDCQVSSNPSAANETAYTIHCAKRKLTSTSRITYSGARFDGTVTISSSDGEIQQVITATRIGPCDDVPALPSTTPPAH